MIEQFREIFSNRYQLARERAEGGQKVIGWVCTYVPEEMIYAAGILPFRVVGGGYAETPYADGYLYTNLCTFSRNCLEEGLTGKLDFLSGYVSCNSCDHIRRLFDNWMQFMKTPYAKALGVPCKATPATLKYFVQDLTLFRKELGELSGREVTDQALWGAIEVYNRTRRLLEELYELRKADPPPISGAEVMEVVRAACVLPREQYNAMLEEMLQEVRSRRLPADDKYRLLIYGSELDSPEYLQVIEDLGGWIVTDDLCMGSRYFRGEVKAGDDPLRALAERYLTKPLCPRMHPAMDRVRYLQQLAQEFQVDGVIHQTLKFCDLHAAQFLVSKAGLDEIGIPVLNLEREYALSGQGQIKTRVSAFFETLEGRRVER